MIFQKISISFFYKGVSALCDRVFKYFLCMVRTLKEDQPLRLLFNLLFYHFNRSEPTYKSQCIQLLDVIAACNQVNVNALNKISITIFSWGRSHRSYLIESRFLIAGY